MAYGNFIIEGNHVDYGITTNGSTTTTYTYDRILQLTADTIVANNVFSGIKDDATKSMVFVSGKRCQITKILLQEVYPVFWHILIFKHLQQKIQLLPKMFLIYQQ